MRCKKWNSGFLPGVGTTPPLVVSGGPRETRAVVARRHQHCEAGEETKPGVQCSTWKALILLGVPSSIPRRIARRNIARAEDKGNTETPGDVGDEEEKNATCILGERWNGFMRARRFFGYG